MNQSILDRKPAFFPFVSAEIFFEADANKEANEQNFLSHDHESELDLESELDELLKV